MKIIGIIAGLVLAFGVFAFVNYSSAVRTGTDSESQIQATYENNRQILGQYSLKVKEAASVTTMATDDLEKVMAAAFEGRYGENGSGAVMQWIREAYPGQIDPVLYRNIQAIVESGRTDFTANQSKLLDQKRVYTNQLSYVWSGFWLKLAGYPKINLDDYKVVTTNSANRAFEAGVDEPLTLR